VLAADNLIANNNASAFGNSITNFGGVFQFSVATPVITPNAARGGSIVLTNGTVSFSGVANAAIGGTLNNITYQGANTLRLDSSTNIALSYAFTNGGNFNSLELTGDNSLWQGTDLTVGPDGAVIANASARVSVSGTYRNLGLSIFSNLHTVASGSRYQSFGGATNRFVGGLTINSGGGLDVTNGVSVIGGAITNSGTINVVNARSVFQGPVVLTGGKYYSDPSTNTFNSSFTVDASSVVTNAPGDVYAFGTDFNMLSTNRTFNMSSARVVFTDSNSAFGITSGVTNHTLNLAGSGALDKGSNWLDHTQLATNFSIGTLTVALSNRVTVTGDKGSQTNALYVGVLDLSAWNTNAGSLDATLFEALYLPNINVYYDKYAAVNAYLQGLQFDVWSGGLLIPIPEPSPFLAVGTGLALLAFLRRRRA
jgi:hypothetical protein